MSSREGAIEHESVALGSMTMLLLEQLNTCISSGIPMLSSEIRSLSIKYCCFQEEDEEEDAEKRKRRR